MTWTNPTHVTSGPASSAQFNEETVDNLLHLYPDGGWVDYTPTDANITVGNGTRVARKCRVGDVCHFVWFLTLGSSSAIAAGAAVGLPHAAAAASGGAVFIADLRDTGTRSWIATATVAAGGTSAALRASDGGALGSGSPFTWTTTDTIRVSGSYEIA